MNLDILLKLKIEDTLNEEEIKMVNTIRKYVEEEKVKIKDYDDVNKDYIHAYIKLVENGIIKEKRKIIARLLAEIAICGTYSFDPQLLDDYPSILKNLDEFLDELEKGYYDKLDYLLYIQSLADYFNSKKDYKNFFKVIKKGANFNLERKTYYTEELKMYILHDNFVYNLYICYDDGKGTKRDSNKANECIANCLGWEYNKRY